MSDLATELPTGWVQAQLDEIVSSNGFFGDGDWIESKDQDPNGEVRLVQLADIGEMRFLDKSRRYLTNAKAQELNCTLLEKGDLLISRLGDPLGKTCVYPGNEEKAVTAVDICILRPATRLVEPRLFAYFLNSGILRQAINGQSSGTTRKRITGKKLKALQVRVPPINEQRRIVEKIETLFARLDQGEADLRQVQTLLARYRQSVLKAAVTGQLTADWRVDNAHRLEQGRDLLARILKTRRETWQGRGKYKEPVAPNVTDLPELPEGWVWASVEQISSSDANALAIGPFGSNLKVEDYRDEGVPLVFVRHIRGRTFEQLNPKFVSDQKAKELASHRVFPGDLLITKMGDPPGDVWIYPAEAPEGVITADCIRFATSSAGIRKEYVAHAIASRLVQSQILRISKGVAQQKVTLANFKQIAIPLPPENEQDILKERIDVSLTECEMLRAHIVHELTRSTALRQSILKQAFAGRLVPQDPNDEPASELLARIRDAQPAAKGRKPRTATA